MGGTDHSPTLSATRSPAPAKPTTVDDVLARCREHILEGDAPAAETLLVQVIGRGHRYPALLALLAQAFRHQGKLAEARQIQEHLLQQQPGNFVYHFDLAETALLQGDFETGWKEYHHRYSLPHTTRIERKVQRPRWDGSPLDGRTILIHDEQGFGDTFQFMRLVPRIKAQPGCQQARVILEINPETRSFAERMARDLPGIDAVIPRGALPPAFDVHCEMMSLPRALGLTWDDVPGPAMPYLTADPARVAHWQERLKDLPRPLVCLVWAGRPTHLNDQQRSMSLAGMAPLGKSGATFLSVQKGERAEDALTPPDGMTMVSLSTEIESFEDTAAIFMATDLLISVDSSPIHLAGALGRPAWVLLPQLPDWRWLMTRETTAWYPQHRLYRQHQRASWGPVIARVAKDLKRFVARTRRPYG